MHNQPAQRDSNNWGTGTRGAGQESADYNLKIGVQAEVVHGDVHIYDVKPSATPEERFEAALNFLNGRVPSRAERLIGEAVDGGYRSNRVAYYWALSVLSGRSFEYLRPADFGTLRSCLTLVEQEAADGWTASLKVIVRFINCLIEQDKGPLSDEELGGAIQDFDHLPNDRQDEIRRHLDAIITGALQDRLDAQYAKDLEDKRVGGDRATRAWKFFEPEPEPPKLETYDSPQFSQLQSVAAGAGTVLGGLALLFALVVATLHQPALAAAMLVGAGGGGYLLATAGKKWLVAREQWAAHVARQGNDYYRASHERYSSAARRYKIDLTSPSDKDLDGEYEYGLSDKADEEHQRKLDRRSDYEASIKLLVEHSFKEENPDGAKNRDRWQRDTESFRNGLSADIIRRYSRPDLTAIQLRWLIIWHAKQARLRWDKGEARTPPAYSEPSLTESALAFLGALAAPAGVVCGLIGALSDLKFGLFALVGLGISAVLLLASDADVYLVRRELHQAESSLSAQRHAANEPNTTDGLPNARIRRPMPRWAAGWTTTSSTPGGWYSERRVSLAAKS